MNKFEAVCKIASDEGWCWDLNCTTCGNMHFTNAFIEMVLGKSPQDDDWLTRADVDHKKLFLRYGPPKIPYVKVRGGRLTKEILIKICLRGPYFLFSRELCISRVAWFHGLGFVWFGNKHKKLPCYNIVYEHLGNGKTVIGVIDPEIMVQATDRRDLVEFAKNVCEKITKLN